MEIPRPPRSPIPNMGVATCQPNQRSTVMAEFVCLKLIALQYNTFDQNVERCLEVIELNYSMQSQLSELLWMSADEGRPLLSRSHLPDLNISVTTEERTNRASSDQSLT